MLTALQWLLGIGGLALIAFGLLWDRPGWRGRAALRCRRCWFDLTGTPGVRAMLARRVAFGVVLAGDPEASGTIPVICGECGTAQRSVRSMRRVRRRWMLALIGCAAVLGGYVWSAWHRTQYAGWVGLVPTPVALLTIPLMSGEPGSPTDLEESQSPGHPRLAIRIRQQIGGRLGSADRCTRLDRWLIRTLARAEAIDVLTDPTSKRGALYQSVYFSLYSQGRLGDAERQWAERVHHVEWRCDQTTIYSSNFYIRPRFRFFVGSGDDYRFEVFDTHFDLVYSKERDPGWWTPVPIDHPRDGWWDGAIGSRSMNHNSWGPETEWLRGRIYRGDRDAGIWWPIAPIHEEMSFTRFIAERKKTVSLPSGGMWEAVTAIPGKEVIDETDELKAWLESNIVAELVWEPLEISVPFEAHPVSFDIMPVGFRLRWRDDTAGSDSIGTQSDEAPAGFTFGGGATLYLDRWFRNGRPAQRQRDQIAFAYGPAVWWAVRDAFDDDGKRVLSHAGERVPLSIEEGYLYDVPFEQLLKGVGDELHDAWIELYFDSVGWDGPWRPEGFRPLSDPGATRFLTVPLQIPLAENDLKRLRESMDGEW